MTAPAHQHGGSTPATIEPAKATPTWQLLVTLVIAGALAGLLVVSVYAITLPAVRKYAAVRTETAVKEVLRSPARWDTLYLVNGALQAAAPAGVDPTESVKAFVTHDSSGRRTGIAIVAKGPGFQQDLELMIGFDPATGAVIGIKVLDQLETPGLGDRIDTDKWFLAQFVSRAAPLVGIKTKPADGTNQVQTITGATISSRAVIRIVNRAVADWTPRVEAFDRQATK